MLHFQSLRFLCKHHFSGKLKHKFRVQIKELRVRNHELRVQNHELGDQKRELKL